MNKYTGRNIAPIAVRMKEIPVSNNNRSIDSLILR